MKAFPRLIAMVVALGTGPSVPLAATDRIVRYADDRLTVQVERVPLRELLAAIGEASGAKIHGEPEEPERAVTAAIDALPAHDAMQRVLGTQPFVLRYDREGKLQTIVLVRGSHAPAACPAVTPEKEAPPPAVALGRPLFVNGPVAEALNMTEAPFQRVIDLAMHGPNAGVRAHAALLSVEALDNDADLRRAFLDTYGRVNPQLAAGMFRSDPGGEAFVVFLAENARTQELKARATAMVEAIQASPE